MIIGIDGNEANVENKVGIGEYAYELIKEFHSLQPEVSKKKELKFIVYLKSSPRDEMPKEKEGWSYKIIKPTRFWTQFSLPIYLFFHRPKLDIFFSPSHYAPRFSPFPTFISVMDLSYLYFPNLFRKSDLYQLRNWTKYSVKNASKVFTISMVSKGDIMKKYGVPDGKVVVTYPGIKKKIERKSMVNIEERYGISGKYILFVGTLQPRKNITRLIEAFSKVKDDLTLIVVGKKGWLYEEILNAPKKFGIEESVKFLDFVPDEDLPTIYKNALCFVLPSLYEGFGLPVLEAMKYGCPVITSDISSLPEAGGDAALYVNPKDVDDIASKIKKLTGDDSLRKKMIEKGKKQIAKFSWDKTARETLSVLMEAKNE